MTGDRRLVALAVGSFLLGVVLALLAPINLGDLLGLSKVLPPFGLRHVLIAPHFASVLCQAVLLALWGVYTGKSPWVRAAGLVAGAAYLEALTSTSAFVRGEFLGLSTMTLAVTLATLLVVRALGVRLPREIDPRQRARAESETEGLRFSIRDLMLFIAAVALLSAVTRGLHGSSVARLLLTAVWAMCFIALGLAALWAALGAARPHWRSMAVLLLSLVLGAPFVLAAHAHPAGCFYIILTMLLYSVLLLGSLLVVRSCGYRFVRRAEPLLGATDDGASRQSPLHASLD